MLKCLAFSILLQSYQVGEVNLLCFSFLFGVHSLSGPGLDLMLLDSISQLMAKESEH